MVTTADKSCPPATADAGTVGDWLWRLVASSVAPFSAVAWTVNGGGGVLLQVWGSRAIRGCWQRPHIARSEILEIDVI